MSPVEFQTCRIATSDGSEEACLCLQGGVILALLVRQSGDAWYLHSGFGPWQREGIIFTSLDEVRAWVDRTASAKPLQKQAAR